MEKPAIGQRSGFRFSLKLLLLSVVPVSLIAAAIGSASATWATIVATLTLLSLFGAVVSAAFDARHRRPIWLGFAVCGGGYLVTLFIAPLGFSEAFGTEQLNQLLLEKLHPGAAYPVDNPGIPAFNEPPKVGSTLFALSGSDKSSIRFLSLVDAATHPLVSEMLLAMVDGSTDGGPPANAAPPAMNARAPANTAASSYNASQSDEELTTAVNFKVIARCAWVWFVGACGACLACYLATRNAPAGQGFETTPAGWVDKNTPSSPLRAVVVGVAILAIGLVVSGFALWNPGKAWACAAMSTAAITSLGLVICAVFGSRQRRPFRTGFAICCGGYFLLCSFADPFQERDSGLNHFLRATAASRSIKLLYERRFTALFPDFIHWTGPASGPFPPGDIGLNCYTTGHGLWAIFLGSFGGMLAQSLVWRRSKGTTVAGAVPKPSIKGALDASD